VRKFLKASGLEYSAGKIKLPSYCRSVRIDVGLSVNAPQSAVWISRDPALHVFGFEPVLENRKSIQRGNSPWPVNLDPKDIGNRIDIIPCALLEKHLPAGLNIYVTKKDPGCSSILKPKTFEVDYVENVQVFSLNEFLADFPFEVIEYISHLKIDVQGADIQVLEGSRKYLHRIMCVTVEVDTQEYESTRNSLEAIREILEPFGFVLLKKGLIAKIALLLKGIKVNAEADDPTFLNIHLYKSKKPSKFWIYQRG
jgi:FkbM family methyltransferase